MQKNLWNLLCTTHWFLDGIFVATNWHVAENMKIVASFSDQTLRIQVQTIGFPRKIHCVGDCISFGSQDTIEENSNWGVKKDVGKRSDCRLIAYSYCVPNVQLHCSCSPRLFQSLDISVHLTYRTYSVIRRLMKKVGLSPHKTVEWTHASHTRPFFQTPVVGACFIRRRLRRRDILMSSFVDTTFSEGQVWP